MNAVLNKNTPLMLLSHLFHRGPSDWGYMGIHRTLFRKSNFVILFLKYISTFSSRQRNGRLYILFRMTVSQIK